MATSQPIKRPANFQDLTGSPPFDRLTVLRLAFIKNGASWWWCRCECGTEKAIRASSLKTGNTKACGCLWRTNGMRHSIAYGPWREINKRCTNRKHKKWRNWGGRGIKVCRRWQGLDGFANFLADMGPRPSRSHQVDRIDNDGHYSCGKCAECLANGWPANCRWATAKQQSRNTRRNHLLSLNGKTQCIAAWAEELGISEKTLTSRIVQSGWSVERALTEPVR